MKNRYVSVALPLTIGVAAVVVLGLSLAVTAPSASANTLYQTLPFSQNWLSTNLIMTDNVWADVPGIVGCTGQDDSTSVEDIPATTVVQDLSSTCNHVKANHTSPNSLLDFAVAEFHTTDGGTNPVVGIRPQTDYDFPHLLLHLNTTGQTAVNVKFDLLDLDGSDRNAAQQIVLQYRTSASGNFTNVPGGYWTDVTVGNAKGPNTPVDINLPADAGNKSQLQLRILSTNADTADEWVGIDNISVTGTGGPPIVYTDFIYLPLVMKQ